jgi:hypothetical protein
MQWWSACSSLLMQCVFCPMADVHESSFAVPWNKGMGIWFDIKCDVWETSHIDILLSVCACVFLLKCSKVTCALCRYFHENWRLWRGIVLYLGKYGNCAALCIILLSGCDTQFLFSFMHGYVVNFVTWSLWGWHTFAWPPRPTQTIPPPHTHTHLP